MKAYPYFRWFVADAEMDEIYSSLSDAELGFFHRLLNKAWTNCGLPADLDQLANVMHVKRSYLDKLWANVGKCFVLTETVHPRLVNPRQEKEREYALKKSERATESVRTRYERRTNDLPRAYGCGSDSSKKESGGVREMPRTTDFPKTDAAIRGKCPSADMFIVTRITEAAVQAYLSVDRPKMPAPTDADIAEAVEQAAKDSPKQHGPGLFLKTVPAVIKSWAELGRHPPGAASKPFRPYVKPTLPLQEQADDRSPAS